MSRRFRLEEPKNFELRSLHLGVLLSQFWRMYLEKLLFGGDSTVRDFILFRLLAIHLVPLFVVDRLRRWIFEMIGFNLLGYWMSPVDVIPQ